MKTMFISTVDSIVDEADALAQLQGDRELFRELADVFLQEIPGIMSRMVYSLGRCDLAELTGAAHQLKGCLPVVGGRAFVEATKRLEKTQSFDDVAALAEQVYALQLGMAKFASALKVRLDRHRPEASGRSFVQAYLAG